jgi:hypothetical protein
VACGLLLFEGIGDFNMKTILQVIGMYLVIMLSTSVTFASTTKDLKLGEVSCHIGVIGTDKSVNSFVKLDSKKNEEGKSKTFLFDGYTLQVDLDWSAGQEVRLTSILRKDLKNGNTFVVGSATAVTTKSALFLTLKDRYTKAYLSNQFKNLETLNTISDPTQAFVVDKVMFNWALISCDMGVHLEEN